MDVVDFDSLILFVGNLSEARAFYVETLGLPVRFEDDIIIVVGGPSGRIVLHRTTGATMRGASLLRGQRLGQHPCASTWRTPTRWEEEARQAGVPVLWAAQEAAWGRFVVVADPDGRPVALAKMSET